MIYHRISLIISFLLICFCGEIPKPSISFGVSNLGNFVPITSFPIQTGVKNSLDLNYAQAANKYIIIQFDFPDNEDVRLTKKFNAKIISVANSIKITTYDICFYQVEPNGLIFRSFIDTPTKIIGKEVLLVSMDTADSLLNYPDAYVFKADSSNISFDYWYDNSQFH